MKITLPTAPQLKIVWIICTFLLVQHTPLLSQEDDVTECPYFGIFSSDTTGIKFSLVSTDIQATISGVIADVTIEQSYFNESDSIVDATYIFPMSTDAAVYGMKMIVNEKVIEAVIKRKEEAQEIFDTANEAGHTASLLEQQRPNVFQMSLANIEPGDSIKIQMNYTELITPEKGIYQFVVPSVVGPRFTTNGEDWIQQTYIDSLATSQTELNIHLQINGGMGIMADCISHNVDFNSIGNSTSCYLSTSPEKDFIVDYRLARTEIETGLLLYEGPEDNFFLSIIQPTQPQIDHTSPDREYVFLMDISGSMSGEPIEISKQLIKDLLENLNSNDKFNIIVFAGGSTSLAPNSLEVNNDNLNMAIDFIDNVSANGGTHILPALERALEMQGTEDFSRTFVIITDGFVAVEKETFDLIRNNLNDANFFAFGIGGSVNRYIIEGIAYVGEGEPFIITDFSEATEIADTFKEYIEKPALTNIEAHFDGIDVYDVEPLSIPDVFAERPIILYGKYEKPAEGTITITGDYGDGDISHTLNFQNYVENINDNIALKYLWARKKIRLMSDYGIASNESDTISIEEEITQLGLKYSLVTEFTSFVAVDSSAVTDISEDNGEDNEGGGGISHIEELDSYSPDNDLTIKVIGNIKRDQGLLTVKLKNAERLVDTELSLQVTDMYGHVIYLKQLNNRDKDDVVTIDLGTLRAGTYIVTLKSNIGEVASQKFIVI